MLLCGRDLDDLERTAADIRARTERDAQALYFGATDTASHRSFVAQCQETIREKQAPLNVFVAFGLMPPQDEIEGNPELARRVVEVTYLGVVSVLTAFAPVLAEQGAGAVIVLGSVAGDRGRYSNYVYGSAKAGVHSFLEGLRARLWRRGVRVVTVKPGFTDTAMTWGLPGMFLVASPEHCARVCLDALRRGSDAVYTPWFWRYIMLMFRLMPSWFMKRLRI